MGRRKKIRTDPEQPTSVEPKTSIPFKEGQVVCDIKVVGINLEHDRSVRFVYARREDVVRIGQKGEKVLIPKSIIRDPQGKVLWDDYVHCMTLGDFQNMIDLRKTAQAEVE